ncbi:MAG: hypothetical protein ACFFCQ_06340 [Promethearchaeota archaeon]
MPTCPNCRRYITRFPCPQCRNISHKPREVEKDSADEFLKGFVSETKTDDNILLDFIETVESESRTTQPIGQKPYTDGISSLITSSRQVAVKKVESRPKNKFMEISKASIATKARTIAPNLGLRKNEVSYKPIAQSSKGTSTSSKLESRISILERELEELEIEPDSGSNLNRTAQPPAMVFKRTEASQQPKSSRSGGINIPLGGELPPPISEIEISPTEQKIYFQLSIEYQIIISEASNYSEGIYNWNLILPQRLQAYGITQEVWEKIAAVADKNEIIQKNLNDLIDKLVFS